MSIKINKVLLLAILQTVFKLYQSFDEVQTKLVRIVLKNLHKSKDTQLDVQIEMMFDLLEEVLTFKNVSHTDDENIKSKEVLYSLILSSVCIKKFELQNIIECSEDLLVEGLDNKEEEFKKFFEKLKSEA